MEFCMIVTLKIQITLKKCFLSIEKKICTKSVGNRPKNVSKMCRWLLSNIFKNIVKTSADIFKA